MTASNNVSWLCDNGCDKMNEAHYKPETRTLYLTLLNHNMKILHARLRQEATRTAVYHPAVPKLLTWLSTSYSNFFSPICTPIFALIL